MIWLTWRQFRTQALAALAVLAAAAVYFVITGQQMRDTYNADLATCAQVGSSQCNVILDEFQRSYNGPQQLFQLLLIAAPALIGIFWGAPLIAAEYERGTHQLAWNQSITPTRWLTVKLAGVGLSAIATAGILSLLLTWWSSPLDTFSANRFDWNSFVTRNVVPLGYAAFTFALGAVLGLFIRRVLPAMALTLAVFIGLHVVFATQLRPNLLPSTTTSQAVDTALLSRVQGIEIGGSPNGTRTITVHAPGPAGAWIQSETNVETSSGQPIPASDVSRCFDTQRGTELDLTRLGACLTPYDLHMSITYQPASHYWPLQWYETGIYLALAALLGAACFWRIRRVRS